jgi:hypothetical protein
VLEQRERALGLGAEGELTFQLRDVRVGPRIGERG